MYADNLGHEMQSLNWIPDDLGEFLLEELMNDWRWEKLFCKPKPQEWKPFKTLKLYPDEEEEPDVWWDVKLEFRLEAYDMLQGLEDEYNTYRAFKGTVSREEKAASFRFVHHHMKDGDAELESVEGDFPKDLYENLSDLLSDKLASDYDSDEEEDDQFWAFIDSRPFQRLTFLREWLPPRESVLSQLSNATDRRAPPPPRATERSDSRRRART